jgi:hypothetical protein
MLHSIESLIQRLDVMKSKAIQVHRLRNEFSEIADKEYDKASCQNILDDIRMMALSIANDTSGDEIITEMSSWKEKG